MNIDYICKKLKKFKDMKPKKVKQAMFNDSWVVKNIYAKGSKQIRVDFERRFATKEDNFVSFISIPTGTIKSVVFLNHFAN